MRIWDLPPRILCRNHLLGEHRELHALWVVITQSKKGYSKHPETLRWVGKLKALYLRHKQLVIEMSNRGYHHNSDLDIKLAVDVDVQTNFIDTPEKQKQILKNKGCPCKV